MKFTAPKYRRLRPRPNFGNYLDTSTQINYLLSYVYCNFTIYLMFADWLDRKKHT